MSPNKPAAKVNVFLLLTATNYLRYANVGFNTKSHGDVCKKTEIKIFNQLSKYSYSSILTLQKRFRWNWYALEASPSFWEIHIQEEGYGSNVRMKPRYLFEQSASHPLLIQQVPEQCVLLLKASLSTSLSDLIWIENSSDIYLCFPELILTRTAVQNIWRNNV